MVDDEPPKVMVQQSIMEITGIVYLYYKGSTYGKQQS